MPRLTHGWIVGSCITPEAICVIGIVEPVASGSKESAIYCCLVWTYVSIYGATQGAIQVLS